MNRTVKIACCVPTYKRAKVVDDFLNTCAHYYINAGIDLYYYDSSPDEETEQVVQEYQHKLEHIFYVHMPVELHSNAKVYKIFQGYGLKKDYDFIWVCGDSVQYSQEAICQLMELIDDKYDIVQMDAEDYESIGTREFCDYNEYLRDCAWEVTLFGAVILNAHTMLKDVDWDYFEKKYLNEDLINLSHVGFYFSRFPQLESFCALHIEMGTANRTRSIYRPYGAAYDIFRVAIDMWIGIVENLPACYTYKQETIKKWGIHYAFASEKTFLSYRRENIFNFRIFLRYFGMWTKVTLVDRKRICLISLVPVWMIKLYDDKKLKKFEKFCKQNQNVYIYGAGKFGIEYAKYLETHNMKYAGFVVTKVMGNENEFVRDKLQSIDNVENTDKNAYIVAVSNSFGSQLIEELKKRKIYRFFYDPSLYEIIKSPLS